MKVHITMIQIINQLFDNKSFRFNPIGIFYFNYYLLINRLMKNMDNVDSKSYSTILFAAARFKYTDYFEYAPTIVKKA